jgi:broad specificity phosphatase PhoE
MPPTVILIRHGQSTFNAHYEATGLDPGHVDAPLTDLGQKQVLHTRALLASTPVDLVVSTPLTRALQTATGIFAGRDLRYHVTCLHRERLESSCDVGRSPRILAEDFPDLAFDHLDDPWWHCGPDSGRGFAVEPYEPFRRRVDRFRDWLAELPEQRVAVVGHGTFFHALTGRWLANCETMEWSPAEAT